jgi:hypothetical protein
MTRGLIITTREEPGSCPLILENTDDDSTCRSIERHRVTNTEVSYARE